MPRVKTMKGSEDKDYINATSKEESSQREVISSRSAWQMWHQNKTMCPKGTVPIRRSTVHDVLRAKSLYHYGKKQSRMGLSRHTDAPDVVSGNGHEVCVSSSSNMSILYSLVFIHKFITNLVCDFHFFLFLFSYV